jgi:hypothetical protein
MGSAMAIADVRPKRRGRAARGFVEEWLVMVSPFGGGVVATSPATQPATRANDANRGVDHAATDCVADLERE